ncbi:MAG: hypothetical protein ACQKBU_11630, partial [Verrucomicrobiales bacterium]
MSENHGDCSSWLIQAFLKMLPRGWLRFLTSLVVLSVFKKSAGDSPVFRRAACPEGGVKPWRR